MTDYLASLSRHYVNMAIAKGDCQTLAWCQGSVALQRGEMNNTRGLYKHTIADPLEADDRDRR